MKCSTGMIEMDVTKEDVPHIVNVDAELVKRGNDIPEGGFWSGVEQNDSVRRLERGSGDDTGTPELQRINDVRTQSHLQKAEMPNGANGRVRQLRFYAVDI
jgi:hypothetical protein